MFNREPTVIFGALAEVIRQVIPMLIIFGIIHWTGEQVAQVMTVVSAVIAFFTIALTRSQVVPNEKANAQIQTAIRMPLDSTVEQVIAKQERESQ